MGIGTPPFAEPDPPGPGVAQRIPTGFPAAFVAGNAIWLNLFVVADEEHPVEPLHRHRSKVITPKDRAPWVQQYPDPRSVAWEEHVGKSARAQALGAEVVGTGVDFTLPLVAMRIMLTLRFNLPKPKSYAKRITAHTKKPDLDNYAKAVLDGLVKGRIIADDGLITDLTIAKRYLERGHPEGVEIELTATTTGVR